MRIGLGEKVPVSEVEYLQEQLENSRRMLFYARSVREAQFFQNRLDYLTKQIKQLKKKSPKRRSSA